MITYTNRGTGKNAHESYKNCSFDNQYTIKHELLHDSLYKYRDLIDYESLIYVICKRCKVSNRYIKTSSCNKDTYKASPISDDKDYTNFVECMLKIYMQSDSYKSTLQNIQSNYPNERDKRIADDIKSFKNKSFFKEYIAPLHFLLVDKHKRIYKIQLNDEFIYEICINNFIYNITLKNTYDFIVPLGEYVWYSDALTDRTKLTSYHDGFISKIPPSIEDYLHLRGKYIRNSSEGDLWFYYRNAINYERNSYIEDVINFFEENIEDIYTDLGVEETRQKFEYVSYESVRQNDRKNRKKELLEELRKLEAEEHKNNDK